MHVIHAETPPHEPSPRARRRDANLGKIVDAAIALVAEEGLAGLSMARLAAAVDYTPGALYRYVDSKDALLAVMMARILDDLRAALVKAAPADAPPIARIAALVRGYVRFAQREPHRFGLLAAVLAEPRVLIAAPAHSTPAAAAVMAALAPLAESLAAAAAAGQLADGDVAERALCVFAMLHGLAQLPKLARHAPGAIDVERLTRSGTGALLVGWGARPAVVEAAFARGGKAP